MDNVLDANIVVKQNNEYDKEQTDIVKMLLTERFFEPWREKYFYGIKDNNSLLKESALEIYITSTCNQACSYCYLYNNKDIYPPEFNKQPLILQNLNILYNWLEDNLLYIPRIELFSGEIWHSDFGLKVLDITYEHLKDHCFTDYIMIPSNCSFVMDNGALSKIQRYINKFKEIGVRLQFSISVDGAIIENYSRPLNNGKIKTEQFYKTLFLFAKHNNYAFHPMVSSYNVKHWIENYQWWQTQMEKYNFPPESLMMLEVRNDDWTDETIQQYCDFMDYLIDDAIKNQFNNNIEDFLWFILSLKQDHICNQGYVPYAFPGADNFQGCTISNHLTVRLGDLAICPCHRTAYNKYLYGKFIVEDNKIIDIIGNNPQMATRVLMSNTLFASIGCDSCTYKDYCLKGCFGSQYESTGDPFTPIASVCKLFKTKSYFMIKKYIDLGIYDIINKVTPYNMHFERIYKFKKFLQEVEKFETK